MAEAGPDRFLVVALAAGPEGRRVALPAERVRALAPVPALTRVPGAPAALVGLADRRGAALPVLDLARLLAPDRRPVPAGRMVLAEAQEPVGLLVPRIVGLAADPGAAAILDLPGLVAGLLPRRVAGPADAAPPAAARAAPDRAHGIALLALTVAGRPYALPLDAVEAVAGLPETIAMRPEAGPGSLGTMPWRGRALPLLSLAARLGLGAAAGRRVAVVRGVGLVAERIGPVLRVSPEAIDPVPRTLRRAGPAAGFVRLDGGTLVCLLSAPALVGEGVPGGVPEPSLAARTEPMVVVALAGRAYGLPAGAVRAVQRAPAALTRVPRRTSPASEGLAGMLAVRGGALPVLDLGRRLGLPPRPGTGRERLVVVEAGGVRAGLLVDGAMRLVRPEEGAIRPVPPRPAGPDAAVTRVAELRDGPLPLLDPAALLGLAASAGGAPA
ncbi:chemotaxis protein CheW [Methylobacterium tarhaniae]|uniref:chemotaxis protein CheW n=1 Tax=Methylobacterium tarhaniae TaxID=1187852 RepID=UPI003D05D62A